MPPTPSELTAAGRRTDRPRCLGPAQSAPRSYLKTSSCIFRSSLKSPTDRWTTTAMTTIMLALRALLIAVCCTGAVTPAPAVYDQRQSGDQNVQIELKNVRVVALVDSELLEDYTDYDYFYDYADFTIKPTIKPAVSSTTEMTTERNDVTDVAGLAASLQDPTSSNSSISESLVNTTGSTTGEGTPSANPTKDSASTTPSAEGDGKGQPSEGSASADAASTGTSSTTTVGLAQTLRSRKRCRSGYAPDGSGRCRRINRRWLSLP